MTYLENSTVRARTTWFELTRQCSQKRQFQRRYCCFWIVATLIPFTLLRMAYLCNFSPINDKSPGIITVESEERVSYKIPTFTSSISSDAGLDVKSSTSHARTDESSWISFHEWVSVENSHSKEHGKKIIKEKKRKTRKSKGKTWGVGHSFGVHEAGHRRVPVSNEKVGSMGMVMVEKQEKPDKRQEEEKEGTPGNALAEERRDVEQKLVEGVVEKREEEELKDVEGIERAQMVEEQIQATENEKVEGKHQDGGAVIVQEVKDHTQDEQHDGPISAGVCDLFEGDWVWDPENPLYTNATCFYMQGAQNCMSNGRPDSDYLHWKWKPRDCDLPRFDARAFLEAFKGKTIAFVGDSLARNQMQSLLCMLSQIEVPKLIYQSHDDATVRWLYEQHQVTLGVVWSPYLLKESSEGIMGFQKGQSVLYLDVLDIAWTSVMQDFDIIVLSIGQWYFKGSIYVRQEEVVGCHYCPGFNLTEIGYKTAYEGAVRETLEKVASEFKGIAVMSTFAISHFEDGPWENGGRCKRAKPLDKEEVGKFPGLHNEMHDIVIDEFNRIAYDRRKLNEGVKLEFLDVTKVSLTRADGHPGPYRRANPYRGKNPDEWVPNDCLHWCLPGPVDTWNQLLVKLVQRHL